MLVQNVRKLIEIPRHYFYEWYMYQYSYLVEQVEVLLSQFEWNSRDSPTETRLTDRSKLTVSLSFVTPANFPRAVTDRRRSGQRAVNKAAKETEKGNGKAPGKKRKGGPKKGEGAPGFEPGTSRSAVECSTTELYPHFLL